MGNLFEKLIYKSNLLCSSVEMVKFHFPNENLYNFLEAIQLYISHSKIAEYAYQFTQIGCCISP